MARDRDRGGDSGRGARNGSGRNQALVATADEVVGEFRITAATSMLTYMHMARTSILLKDDLLLEVRRIAQTRGTTITDVIHEALRTYVGMQPRSGLPSFTAVGRSEGRDSGNLGRRAKRVARGAVDPHEGSREEGRR